MDDEIFVFLGFVVLNLIVFAITLVIWSKYNRTLYFIIKRDHSKSPLLFSHSPRTDRNTKVLSNLSSRYLHTCRSDEYANEHEKRTIRHIFGSEHPPIRNNEVKLYLNFLSSNMRMLLICSITAFAIYTPWMIHLACTGKPWSFWRLSNIDFIGNKHMVRTLYSTVWIYSIIIYFHILCLLTDHKVDKKSTATRAQFHTIMVTGLRRNSNDPQVLYDHFDNIFPNQIISSHLIMDYTRRLIYENQLELLMWQSRRLDLCTANKSEAISSLSYRDFDDFMNTCDNYSADTDKTLRYALPKSPDLLYESSFLPEFNRGDKEGKCDFSGYETNPKKVSINLRINRISEKLRKIKELPLEKSLGVGFVSFKDARCVYKSLTDKRIYENMPNWSLEPAPHPKDIIWRNLRFSPFSISIRAIAFNLLFLSFYIGITYVMANLNLLNTVDIKDSPLYNNTTETLIPEVQKNDRKGEISNSPQNVSIDSNNSNQGEFNSNVNDGSGDFVENSNRTEKVINKIPKNSTGEESRRMFKDSDLRNIGHISFWRAMLPPIIMGIINSVIHPYVITLISEYIGFHRESAQQKYRLFGHTFYLITGTILVPLLSSILALWQILSQNFIILSQYLGLVMSGASWAYAAIYILNATLISCCNQLLQVSQIFCRWFSRTFFNYDYGDWDFDFGYWYAFHTSILTLVLMFSTLIPSVLPMGTMYFLLRYYVDRYNLSNGIWKIGLDTTGKIGNTAIRSTLISVSLFQFGMSGIFLNCNDALEHIYSMILFIASVASWLLIYGSTTETTLKSLKDYYTNVPKSLAHRIIDFIKICYLHPCDKTDMIKEFKVSFPKSTC